MQAAANPPAERIGSWQRCQSRSTGKNYWFNIETKQSVWEDKDLPHGWAWGKDSEASPVWYLDLYRNVKQAHKPTTPAGVAPAAPAPVVVAPASSSSSNGTALALTASLTAGDDLLSEAYIPDERPEVQGRNIDPKIASKRDYLFSSVPAELRWRLQVDAVALYSITEARLAEAQSQLIKDRCIVSKAGSGTAVKSPKELVVVDATACVGGNTLSFARHFGLVHAVELSEQRARMLQHNAKQVCGFDESKVRVHNASFLDLFVLGSKLNQALLPLGSSSSSPLDVVFFDPPWGGPEYKTAKSLDMFLGTVDVADIIAALLAPSSSLVSPSDGSLVSLARYVVMKAPTNYNTAGLKTVLARAHPGISVVAEAEQWKMLLLVIKAPSATSAGTSTTMPALLKQLLASLGPASAPVAGMKRGSAEAGLDNDGLPPAAKRMNTTTATASSGAGSEGNSNGSNSNSSSGADVPAIPVLPANVLEEILLGSSPSLSSLSPSAAAAASTLSIPVLRRTGVAGTGRRAGEVFEATPVLPLSPSSAALLKGYSRLVVKRQPMDARTAKENAISLALVRQAPSLQGEGGSSSPLVALPFFIAEGQQQQQAAAGLSSSSSVSFAVFPHVGRSLEDSAPSSSFSLGDAITLLRRLLTALDRLHSSGFLFLDLHRGNVLVSSSSEDREKGFDTACLIDLGSAQQLDSKTAEGSACYCGPTRGGVWDAMPPEQFGKGKWANEGEVELSPSSDLFALASLLIHLMVGECAPFNPLVHQAATADSSPPFAAFFASLKASRDKPPPPAVKLTVDNTTAPGHILRQPQQKPLLDAYIRGAIEHVTSAGGVEAGEAQKDALFAVLSKALNADPKARWQSAKEMMAALG